MTGSTDPRAAYLAAKALADFWSDMGVPDETAELTTPERPAAPARTASARSAPASDSRASEPLAQGERLTRSGRPEPRRLGNQNPVAEARAIAAAQTSLPALRTAISAFEGCPLKKSARNTVVYDGALDADIMLVGEAPGAEEDAAGLPFVGRAGKLLDRMLATIGVDRAHNIFITNIVYWRPPGNRDPSPDEVMICAPFLARQIELKRPKLLLTAGKFATQAMLGAEDGIMRLRGRKLRYRQDGLPADIPCVPLLHPAYLLRRPQDKAKAWEDLLTIAALCDDLGVQRQPGL